MLDKFCLTVSVGQILSDIFRPSISVGQILSGQFLSASPGPPKYGDAGRLAVATQAPTGTESLDSGVQAKANADRGQIAHT